MYPVEPVTLPPDIAHQQNGHITGLHNIPGGGMLEAYTYWYWTILVQECAKAGIVLTYTGTYRSYDQQVQLFQERYTRQNTGRPSKVWNGVIYYLKPGEEMAAIPGTSNHGYGIAIDISLNGYGKAAQPVTQHALDVVRYIIAAHDLGFSWEGNPNSPEFEVWHIRHYRPS